MRLLSQACLVPAVVAALGCSTAPAEAESTIQRIFGLGSGGRYTAFRSYGRFRNYGAVSRDGYDAQFRSPGSGGLYRTVCVRMCDGYYWPVSSSASRGKFYRDAAVCQSSCNEEARLFYLPRFSDDVAKMTDLSGRAYGRLPEAFAYRKTLSGGCTCKPEPWSEAAMSQHQLYADIEAENIRHAAAEREAARALALAKIVTDDPASVSEAEPETVPSQLASVSVSEAVPAEIVSTPLAEEAGVAAEPAALPRDQLADASPPSETVVADAETQAALQPKKARVEAARPARYAPLYQVRRQRYAARGAQARRGLLTW